MSFLQTLSYYRKYQLSEAEIPLQDYVLDDPATTRDRLQSGQYPTPQSLAATQCTLGEAPRQQLVEQQQPPPPPFPSNRTKAELINKFGKNFSAIDARSRAELPRPNDDWATLSSRLYSGCRDDLQRLRAAFVFVCAVSSRRKLARAELESPVHRSLRRMAESIGLAGEDRHSDVFASLLSEAGVPFELILGYKKGVGLAPGFRTPVGGRWFACFVSGEWRLVDIGWAAQVADPDDQGYVGSEIASEFFFLTDPEQFVVTHLPMEHQDVDNAAAWQLLSRPLSRDEFDRLPMYFAGGTAGEFERHWPGRGLTGVNWPWNVVLGRPGEPLELEIRELQQPQQPCRYVSVFRCLSTTGRQPSASSVSRPLRTDRDGVLKFKVDPPWPGKFYLEIRLLTEDDAFSYDDCFIGFALHCPLGCGDGDGFPSGELAEFGPPQRRSQQGELGCDIAGGELLAPEGETALALMELGVVGNGQGHRRLDCRVYEKGDKRAPPGTAYLSRLGAHLFAPAGGGRFAFVLRLRNRPVCQFLLLADCGAADADGAAWRRQSQPNWQRLVDSVASQSDGSNEAAGEPYKATTLAELSVPIDPAREEVQRAELLRVVWRRSQSEQRQRRDPGDEDELVPAEAATATVTERGDSVVCRFRLPGNYLLKLMQSSGEGDGDWRVLRCHPVRVFTSSESAARDTANADDDYLDEAARRLSRRQRWGASVRLLEQRRRRWWRRWRDDNNGRGGDEEEAAAAAAAADAAACQRLEAAMAATDASAIEAALKERAPTNARNLTGRACLLLATIDLKAELQRALALSDPRRLRRLLSELDDLGLKSTSATSMPTTSAAAQLIASESAAARQALWRVNRRAKQPRHRLSANSRSLTELRRYARPQDAVHSTVQAVLLLAGHYEKRTRKWKRCQPLLRNILHDMDSLDPSSVDPRIAARSKQILDGIDAQEVQQRSAAALAFYEWGVKTVAGIESATPPDQFKPASVRLQARLLGVSPAEDAKYHSDEETGSVSGLSVASSKWSRRRSDYRQ